MNLRALPFALSAILLLSGCHDHALPSPTTEPAKAEQRAMMESQREQLAMIPPPSKNRYMTVRTYEGWENPYITVQAGMLTLHVLLADANTTSIGVGGIMRPLAARRQELNIGLDKLGDAVSAIPQSSWPYGRVIALEEAHKTPVNAQPAVRRTMENAVGMLNDLGVVSYDMSEGNIR